MKRFCNRRSTPKSIHSDNAGEFIQGKNIITNVFDDLNTYKTHQKLQDELSITWYHSPSRAPQHSGVIERIVGTIKKTLNKNATRIYPNRNRILHDFNRCRSKC